MQVDDIYQPSYLRKATKCAKLAGLSAAMFVSSCAAGQIPCEVIRLGERKIAYVRTAEFDNWMGSLKPKDLFA